MNEIEKKLWELRISVVKAWEKYTFEKSIRSSKEKISGFSENGILMNPQAMQQMVTLLESSREADIAINNFSRSRPVVKKVDKDVEAEGMLARFGRSVCTSQPEEKVTAADLISTNLLSKKEDSFSLAKKDFKVALKKLEDFMKENNLSHPLRCKNEHISEEDVQKMITDAEVIGKDNQDEKMVILRQIKKLQRQTVYESCTNKPYQCMVCPFYYKDMADFFKLKQIRKEGENSDK